MKGIDFKKQLAVNTANTLKNNKLISSENVKNNLTILPELKSFIPPLNDDEYRSLEESIILSGCRTPILVWDTTKGIVYKDVENPTEPVFVLFDGHHRYEICKRNNVDFQIDLMTFQSIEEVKTFMIDFQIGRRNMTSEQISYFRGLKYQRLKTGQGGLRTGKTIEESGLENTAQKLAEEFNVSPATIKRDAVFAEGLEKMSPVLKAQVLTGKAKIDKKAIQKLAKSTPESPITSIEELYLLTDGIAETKKNEQSDYAKRIRESIKNADDSELTISVKGSFLVKNGLGSIWKTLRNLPEATVIDLNYSDTISISEAATFGIIGGE
ncbi:hypothetical protein VB796_15530 [Arcicella sp. LKC2W]|uniref:hypothetical protein n=1 Tax=Arcicella sp. LKC2W TaxID=2984198 RepID=UPI002B20DC42|nr:hypothetical protein [Arcicella sp. LKC2W]MEA5460465.1 hypothetical protein [Arcicella sp. LKC2W]